MSLHSDLLEQSQHLAARDRRRPKQANLRRAVSTAYYAMFHLLIDEACRLVLAGNSLAALRPRLGRAFVHAEMKQVSRAFTLLHNTPKLPGEINAIVQALAVPPSDLQFVAQTFVDLQQVRHEADYDTGRLFNRQEVNFFVATATDAFRAWQRVRRTPLAQAYLIALLVSKKWDRE